MRLTRLVERRRAFAWEVGSHSPVKLERCLEFRAPSTAAPGGDGGGDNGGRGDEPSPEGTPGWMSLVRAAAEGERVMPG